LWIDSIKSLEKTSLKEWLLCKSDISKVRCYIRTDSEWFEEWQLWLCSVKGKDRVTISLFLGRQSPVKHMYTHAQPQASSKCEVISIVTHFYLPFSLLLSACSFTLTNTHCKTAQYVALHDLYSFHKRE